LPTTQHPDAVANLSHTSTVEEEEGRTETTNRVIGIKTPITTEHHHHIPFSSPLRLARREIKAWTL
jgi:hypothetical protein